MIPTALFLVILVGIIKASMIILGVGALYLLIVAWVGEPCITFKPIQNPKKTAINAILFGCGANMVLFLHQFV